MRAIKILCLIALSCCGSPKPHAKPHAAKKPLPLQGLWLGKFDTLPNGKRIIDNRDSSLSMYYKEVVGSDTLKGGYINCYAVDDSMKYLYLRKGNTLHLLNKTVDGTMWGLGILEKDYDSLFITAIDNGNGTPSTYQVFQKSSGKNMLGDGVEAWDYEKLGDTFYFLCDNRGVSTPADSVFLYNIKSGRRQAFKLPPAEPYNTISYEIANLNSRKMIIRRKEEYPNNIQYPNYANRLIKYNR